MPVSKLLFYFNKHAKSTKVHSGITGKKVKFQRGKSSEYSQFNIPCLGYQW